jgi:hypothetical protein
LRTPGISGHSVDFEFEPRAARQFHFCVKQKAAIRFKGFDAPKIDGITDLDLIWMLAAPSQSHAAYEKIQKTPDAPEKLLVVPAGPASNAADWDERF